MYQRIINIFCIILISDMLFSTPLIYAQENSISQEEIDNNGLRPQDYDKNGWAKDKNGKWVASPNGAIFKAQTSWALFNAGYNEKNGDYNLLSLQVVNGKGINSKSNTSEEEITVYILHTKDSETTEGSTRKSVYISFEIKPSNGAKSLRNTLFDSEEKGTVTLQNARDEIYLYDFTIKPGDVVECSAFSSLLVETGEEYSEPSDIKEMISLLQKNETYKILIEGKGNWSCEFELQGGLPEIKNNWTPYNNGYEYLVLDTDVESDPKDNEKPKMSTGKKILIGIGIVALTALAIYGGYKGYQYMKNQPVKNVLPVASSTGTKSGSTSKSNPKPSTTTIGTAPSYKGGYFGDIPKESGKEVHHIITDSAILNSKRYNPNGLNRGSAPAIQMDKADHRLLPSTGTGTVADAFQTKQMNLLSAGKTREAFEMGIKEIKDAGLYEKYESAINEARKELEVLIKEGRAD